MWRSVFFQIVVAAALCAVVVSNEDEMYEGLPISADHYYRQAIAATAGTPNHLGGVPQDSSDEFVEAQLAALHRLYNATSGDTWHPVRWPMDGLDSVNSPGFWTQKTISTSAGPKILQIATFCEWEGIICATNTSNITGIELVSNNMTGNLPYSLEELSSLAVLNLYGNPITGHLHDIFLHSISQIQFLNLTSNFLTGSLPTGIGYLTRAASVTLYGNRIEGSLPTEIGYLKNIQSISFGANLMTGSIPSELCLLSNLVVAGFVSNSLSGPLPTCIDQMQHCLSLMVGDNQLSGTIPDAIARMPKVIILGLLNNTFTGTLPQDIGNLSSLRSFLLSNNFISGDIPDSFYNLTGLEKVWAVNNRISGTLSPKIGNLRNLRQLWLGQNSLRGSIPSEIGMLNHLLEIGLISNSFNGSLPTEIGNLKHLESLLLDLNQLSGSLPPHIGNLTSMTKLWLQNNDFSGAIPSELGKLTYIEEIWMSSNQLSGTIPIDLWNLSKETLSLFAIGNNHISGSIPSEIGLFSNLQYLELNDNNFTGVVPTELLTLPLLPKLDVSDNPLDVTSVPQPPEHSGGLAILDMTNTSLQVALEKLPTGRVATPFLILSNNPDVSGTLDDLPHSGVGGRRYIELYLSNCSLTGTIPNLYQRGYTYLNVLDVSFNQGLSGDLPVAWLRSASQLTLNVTGNTLRREGDDALQFGSTFTTFDTYRCPELYWGSQQVSVVGLHPSYFAYEQCSCLFGFSGTPPNCAAESDTTLVVGLSVSLVVLLLTVVLLVQRRVRRWFTLQKELKYAHQLLADYAGNIKRAPNGSDDAGMRGLMPGDENELHGGWLINYEDVVLVKTVGAGASARVSLGVWNHVYVAVKEFHAMSEDEADDFAVEAAVHVKLHHPNVVQLLGICTHPHCTLTEWMEHGSLYDVIHSRPDFLPPARRLALDIARGMSYLHFQGVLHRDLKSLNVLLNSSGIAKVADFGHARERSERTMTQGQGTAAWMAPEVFAAGRYTEKCDVYSYGIVLWEILTREHPFANLRFVFEFQDAVTKGVRPALPTEGDPVLLELIQDCWRQDPELRPSFEEILNRLDDGSISLAMDVTPSLTVTPEARKTSASKKTRTGDLSSKKERLLSRLRSKKRKGEDADAHTTTLSEGVMVDGLAAPDGAYLSTGAPSNSTSERSRTSSSMRSYEDDDDRRAVELRAPFLSKE